MPAPAPPVFVISLKRTPERRALAAERMEAAGIPFEFIDAVDGQALSEAEVARLVDQAAAQERLGRPLRPGEIGCALSHGAIYQRMLDEGIEAAVVLEDDAIPAPALARTLERIAAGDEQLVLLYHAFTYAPLFGRRSWPLCDEHRLYRTTAMPRCTVGYYLTRHAAKVLLDAMTPVRMQADWPVAIDEVLAAKVVHPHVVHQDIGIASTISDHDHVRRSHQTVWDVVEDLTCIPYLRDRRKWGYSFRRYVRERMLSVRIKGPPHQPCGGCGTGG